MNYELSTEHTPKVYVATDHAGFELKEKLVPFVRDELGYEVEDLGATTLEGTDDYPEYMARAALAIAGTRDRAIVFGGSGQGEAIAMNRFAGVRAAVYYGDAHTRTNDADENPLSILAATRLHNDANALSIGARFVSEPDAREAVRTWLEVEFSGGERHVRRNAQLDDFHT